MVQLKKLTSDYEIVLVDDGSPDDSLRTALAQAATDPRLKVVVLSCHACYCVSPGESFADNLREITRVLGPGGRFIFSLSKTDNYILKDSTPLGHGHYRITHDPYGIRNGSVFRAFASREEVREELGAHFSDLALGLCENDFYGIYEKVWIGTELKKVP